MKYKKKDGFTLIELLVVIGIIMVLASILTPALLRAREQANRATCLSNIRSIGQAMQIYANENDDYYPVADYSTDTTLTIFARIYHKKNFNNMKVFVCPNRKRNSDPVYNPDTSVIDLPNNNSHISYAVVCSYDASGASTADGAASIVTPMTTDPGSNYLLIEDPACSTATGADSYMYDDFDNHGIDGTNTYSISGQAKWVRGKSDADSDSTFLPGPNKDIDGNLDVSLDGTDTQYDSENDGAALIINENGIGLTAT